MMLYPASKTNRRQGCEKAVLWADFNCHAERSDKKVMKWLGKMWTFIYHSKTLRLQPCLKMLPNLVTKRMRACKLLSFPSSFPCFPYFHQFIFFFFSSSSGILLCFHILFFLWSSASNAKWFLYVLHTTSVCLQFFLIYNKAGAWLSLKVDSSWVIYQLCRLHFLNLVSYLVYKDILHAVSG